MKTVKAIVLTYDKNRALTDHMIFKYNQLWPNHPFQFRVAYQDLAPTMATDTTEYKKTPFAIKPTILSLLDDLDDDELIYWCIDDKYPIKLDVPSIERMYQWLSRKESSAISGVLFCRCRKNWTGQHLTGRTIVDDAKNIYLESKNYYQIWIHQFLRVKVLRYLFESFPDEIPYAKIMDKYKNKITKPSSHQLFVSSRNLAVFGESTSRGIVTRNCYSSILECGLPLPAWYSGTNGKNQLSGVLPENIIQKIYYYVKGQKYK